MQIEFETLHLLPKIYELLKNLDANLHNSTAKRWLTTKELGEYLGYSIDGINKMVKEGVFVSGVHYYKPSKKLLFDKEKIDNWIIGISYSHDEQFIQQKIEKVFQTL